MRTVVRVAVAALLAVHGLVHLLGVVKGLGLADVAALEEPVSPAGAVLWATAGALVLATAAGLLARTSWWWRVGAVAAAASQLAVVTSWSDAGAGTLANVLLLVAVAYGWARNGPRSLRAQFESAVAEAQQAAAQPRPLVTEADLGTLPPLVADWLRASGAVGRPPVSGIRARMTGRIRSDAGQPWMTFRAEQVSSYAGDLRRTFSMDATMRGLPVDVLHRYAGGRATMRVKPLSLFSLVDASGPQLDRAETVTVLNDLCVLSPAALLDLPVAFEEKGDRRFRVTLTNGPHTVSAVVVLDSQHRLVDFVSDDRGRLSSDGTSLTPARWSTPMTEHGVLDGRVVPVYGVANWLTPVGSVTYAQMRIDACVCLPREGEQRPPGTEPRGSTHVGDPDGTRTRDLRRDRAAR